MSEDDQPLEYPPAIDGVPADRAWTAGRRIYVKSSYKSKLSDALWAAGFTWDRENKLHYVGTGKAGAVKLEQVLPAIREAEDYARQTADLRAAGHWAEIPLGKGMKEIREKAKELGARFDGERKQWALPSAEAAAQVAALVEAARPGKARGAAPVPAPRPRRTCDHCGKGRPKHERHDSSGIPGTVCDACNREPGYALSFA